MIQNWTRKIKGRVDPAVGGARYLDSGACQVGFDARAAPNDDPETPSPAAIKHASCRPAAADVADADRHLLINRRTWWRWTPAPAPRRRWRVLGRDPGHRCATAPRNALLADLFGVVILVGLFDDAQRQAWDAPNWPA